MCVRQSTYRGLGLDSWTNADEVVPICGPVVLNILKQRLESAIKDISPFIADLNLNEDDKKFLNDNLLRINRLLGNSLLSNFINSIVGHSIRKGLLLAERLISNSVYDILKYHEIKKGDIINALLLGNDNEFNSSRDGSYIDNIYYVTSYDYTKGPILIKLRLLRLLSKKNDLRDGLPIGDIYDYLVAFGYTDNVILNAVNDMLHESKRLVWSNSMLFYRNISELLSVSKSSLFISSAGEEYQNFLYQNIEYLRQVMLVFSKKNQIRKVNSTYGKMIEDIKEIHSFSNSFDLKIYKEIWNGDCRLSLDILQSVKLNIEKIFKNDQSKIEVKEILSNLRAMIHECNNKYKNLYARDARVLCDN